MGEAETGAKAVERRRSVNKSIVGGRRRRAETAASRDSSRRRCLMPRSQMGRIRSESRASR